MMLQFIYANVSLGEDGKITLPSGNLVAPERLSAMFSDVVLTHAALVDADEGRGYIPLFDEWKVRGLIE